MRSTLIVPRTCLAECGSNYILSAIGPYVEVHEPCASAKLLSRILPFAKSMSKVSGIVPIFSTGFVVVYGKCFMTLLHKNELSSGDFVVPESRVYKFSSTVHFVHPLEAADKSVEYAIHSGDRLLRTVIAVESNNISLSFKHEISHTNSTDVEYCTGTTWDTFDIVYKNTASKLVSWRPAVEARDCSALQKDPVEQFTVSGEHVFGYASKKLFHLKLNDPTRSSSKVFAFSPNDPPNRLAFSPASSLLFWSDRNGTIVGMRTDDETAPLYRCNPENGEITSLYASESTSKLIYSTAMGTIRTVPYKIFKPIEACSIPVKNTKKILNFASSTGRNRPCYIVQLERNGHVDIVLIDGKTEKMLVEDVDYVNWTSHVLTDHETIVAAYSTRTIWCFRLEPLNNGKYKEQAVVVTLRPKDVITSVVVSFPFIVLALVPQRLKIWPLDFEFIKNCGPGSEDLLVPKGIWMERGLKGPIKLTTINILFTAHSPIDMCKDYHVYLGTKDGAVITIKADFFGFGVMTTRARLLNVVVLPVEGRVPIAALSCDWTTGAFVLVLNEKGSQFVVDRTGNFMGDLPRQAKPFVPHSYIPTSAYLCGIRDTNEFVLYEQTNRTFMEICAVSMREKIVAMQSSMNFKNETATVCLATTGGQAIWKLQYSLSNFNSIDVCVPTLLPFTVTAMTYIPERNALLLDELGEPFVRVYGFRNGESALKAQDRCQGPTGEVLADMLYQKKMHLVLTFCVNICTLSKVGPGGNMEPYGKQINLQAPVLQLTFVEELETPDSPQAMPIILVVYESGIVTVVRHMGNSSKIEFIFKWPVDAKVCEIRATSRNRRKFIVWGASETGRLYKCTTDLDTNERCKITYMPGLSNCPLRTLRVLKTSMNIDAPIAGTADGTLVKFVDIGVTFAKASNGDQVSGGACVPVSVHAGAVKAMITHKLKETCGEKSLVLSLGMDCQLAVCIFDATQHTLVFLMKVPTNVPNPTILSMGTFDLTKSSAYVLVGGDGLEVVELCRKKVGLCMINQIVKKQTEVEDALFQEAVSQFQANPNDFVDQLTAYVAGVPLHK